MRDERGLYYYAEPGNTKVRVYVRRNPAGGIDFRLWEIENPQVWDKHGWVPHEVIVQAAALYREERNPNSNPLLLYDVNVANALLKEDEA